MKHEIPSYLRKGRVIVTLDENGKETNVKAVFPSISAAKRESARLQKSNGGLGCGYVKVVK